MVSSSSGRFLVTWNGDTEVEDHEDVDLGILHRGKDILFCDLSRNLDLGIIPNPVDRNGCLSLVQPRRRLW